jgi:hypothetical protein
MCELRVRDRALSESLEQHLGRVRVPMWLRLSPIADLTGVRTLSSVVPSVFASEMARSCCGAHAVMGSAPPPVALAEDGAALYALARPCAASVAVVANKVKPPVIAATLPMIVFWSPPCRACLRSSVPWSQSSAS